MHSRNTFQLGCGYVMQLFCHASFTFFFYRFPETITQNNKIMLPNDIFYVLCTMCVFDLTTFYSFLIAKIVYFC